METTVAVMKQAEGGLRILDRLRVPAYTINIELTKDATPAQAQHAVETVCAGLAKAELTVKHFRVLLGRLMRQVQLRRLYEPEFTSFEQYTQALARKYKLSRPTLRKALRIAKYIPDLEPKEADKMPLANLELLAAVASKTPAKNLIELRKAAPKLNVVEFRERVQTDGLMGRQGRPATNGKEKRRVVVVLKLSLSAALAKRYQNLRGSESDAKFIAGLLETAEAGMKRTA